MLFYYSYYYLNKRKSALWPHIRHFNNIVLFLYIYNILYIYIILFHLFKFIASYNIFQYI